MMEGEQTLGQIAYNAYCESVEWTSFNGQKLPAFSDQSAKLQAAWCDAGQAVADYLEKS